MIYVNQGANVLNFLSLSLILHQNKLERLPLASFILASLSFLSTFPLL